MGRKVAEDNFQGSDHIPRGGENPLWCGFGCFSVLDSFPPHPVPSIKKQRRRSQTSPKYNSGCDYMLPNTFPFAMALLLSHKLLPWRMLWHLGTLFKSLHAGEINLHLRFSPRAFFGFLLAGPASARPSRICGLSGEVQPCRPMAPNLPKSENT